MDAPSAEGTAVPNRRQIRDLPGDNYPTDWAIYVPSVPPKYAIDAYASIHGTPDRRPLPQGVQASDLDFLDPNNPLFRISHAMSSAGLARKQNKPCIITQRDRNRTRIVVDSGGYQALSQNADFANDQARTEILRWQEAIGDIAITLDAPTLPLQTRAAVYQYKSFRECLDVTLAHLDFFNAHRDPNGHTIFLNCLHGNDARQAKAWYEAVKHYPFEGYAFAGPLKDSFYHVCGRINKMAEDGLLQRVQWLHFLGTCQLETAVMLTALQRAINSTHNMKLRISFDTSTPFSSLGSNSIYTQPQFRRDGLAMPQIKAPADPSFFGSNPALAVARALSAIVLVLGDICVQCAPNNGRFHDGLADRLLSLHNLATLHKGVEMANRLFDLQMIHTSDAIHTDLLTAVRAIYRVIQDPAALPKLKSTFGKLCQYRPPEEDDDGREY